MKLKKPKKMLESANEQLADEIMNCQDMPLKEAMAENLVKFSFPVPRYFKERFTGVPDESRLRRAESNAERSAANQEYSKKLYKEPVR